MCKHVRGSYHLVAEVDGARLGLVGRGGGVAELRPRRQRGVVPRAAGERDGRPAARRRPRPVREGALHDAAGERREVVVGLPAQRVQDLLERAAAGARRQQRQRGVDGPCWLEFAL